MMDQTIKLYDNDAYMTKHNATVISTEPVNGSDKEWWIILDRTAFFPEAGGQTPDKGTIANAAVLDVQIEGGVIRHRVWFDESGQVPKAGDVVECHIDWSHRFSNMQNHTGEHIFSGFVHSLHGYDNVGFHLSDHIVTMDYSGMLSPEEIAHIELLSNRAIWEAHTITTYYPTDEQLQTLDYRSKGELTPPIRIVEIEGVDMCACCAPHVRNTSEVGILKVVGFEKYKSGIRLSILCGERALYDYRDKQERVQDLTQILSVKPGELQNEARRLLDEKGRLEHTIRTQQERILDSMIADVSDDEKDVWIFTGDMDPNAVRNAINTLAEKHSGFCGIFYGDTDSKKFIIASGKGEDGKPLQDAREVLTVLKNSFEVKGGGSNEMVQGSVTADEQALRSRLSQADL